MDSKGHEPDAVVRIESLDGLHKADIALLDQITKRQSVAGVSLGDVHDESQVCHDQFTCCVEITEFVKADGERLLIFLAEDRYRTYRLDIGIQTADRSGQHDVAISCRNSTRHAEPPTPFNILALGSLEC